MILLLIFFGRLSADWNVLIIWTSWIWLNGLDSTEIFTEVKLETILVKSKDHSEEKQLTCTVLVWNYSTYFSSGQTSQKGATGKKGTDTLAGSVVTVWREMLSSLKRANLGNKEIGFYSEGGEALEQVAQRCGGCPIPGGFQGETGSGLGQPDLAVHVPVRCRRVGLDGLKKSLPTPRILWLRGSACLPLGFPTLGFEMIKFIWNKTFYLYT